MRKKNLFYLVTIVMVTMLSVGFVSCGGDDDEEASIDVTPISLFAGNDKTIQGADTITSSNRYVAYAKGNVVHGWHVGETTLLVNGKKTIPITVSPKYYLYDNPVCKWECNMDYVKNNQKEGALSSKSTNTMLLYEDAGAASILAYNFENGKLKSVLAVVSTKHASEYGSYLAERFLMLPYYKGEDTYFVGADAIDLDDASTVVMMEIYSVNQLVTVYMPAKDYSTRSAQSTGSIKEKALKLIE